MINDISYGSSRYRQSSLASVYPGVGPVSTSLSSRQILNRWQQRFRKSTLPISFVALVMAVLFAACSLIYMKNAERCLFNDLQCAKYRNQQLHIERGQLLLEQSTWARPRHVQSFAQHRLHMHYPEVAEVTLVVPA